jgi:hypothetical protein
MRSSLVLGGCCAAALLSSDPAHALSLETTCENIKLRAAGGYARCLARAAKQANSTGSDLTDEGIERCNQRFDRVFEWAETIGTCRTAGGPSSLRGPILGQTMATLAATTAGPGCPSTPVADGDTYVCTLKTGSAVDLAEIVAQIGVPDVTLESPVWIEAWGASGGTGNTSNGGGGAAGGYAQTTTTVIGLGSSTVYYYLGKAGTGGANAGGDGGTATLVTVNDLTKEAPTLDDTLLIAAGGGGGGAGRGKASACGSGGSDLDVLGGGGGSAGEAIADTSGAKSGAGAQGGGRRSTNVSGFGGDDGKGGAIGGGGADAGAGGIAALGGVGGGHSDPTTGFSNQSGVKVTASGGKGGAPGDDAGGGGGGGGYGGGGGGREGTGGSDCVSGGGGGGASFAQQATASCTRERPGDSPNGSAGAVQIVFQVGPCS